MRRSFQNALRGIGRTVRCERNMRIHLAAATYVVFFGFLAELDTSRWGAVLLCCGVVMAAELINTALENLCDAVHPEQNPKIGAAKDAAAGAVLALAAASVAVAVAVFGPWLLAGGLLERRWGLVVAVLCAPLGAWFVIWPGNREGKQ